MLVFLAGVAVGIWGKSIALWLLARAGAALDKSVKRVG